MKDIHTLRVIECLTDSSIPNSIEEKKLNKSRAIKNLEFAKGLNKSVRFAKPGEGQFSKEQFEKEKELKNNVLTAVQASRLINTSVSAIMQKKKAGKLPFEKIKGVLYFNREDVLIMDSLLKRSSKKKVDQKDLTGFLTAKQASELTDISLDTLRSRVFRGHLKPEFKYKRKLYFKESDILELKENHLHRVKTDLD
jgi:hypothetical protein